MTATPAGRLLAETVLVVAVAVGAWAAAASAATLVVGHTEGVDGAMFLLAFAVLLPTALVAIVHGGPFRGLSDEAVSWLATVAAGGLVFVVCAAKVVDELGGDGVGSAAPMMICCGTWLAALASLWLPARRGRGLLGVDRLEGPFPSWLALVAVPLLVVVAGADALPPIGDLLLSLALGAALLGAVLLGRSWKVGRRWIIAIDVIAVVGIVLLAGDVTIFTIDAASWGLQLHHHTTLGPANDVLGGRSMLVDTYSIYGVGSMYFFAGLFELIPLGYGSFGVLLSVAFTVMYAIGYAILRLTGASPPLSVTALFTAIVSSVFSTIATPVTFPSLGPMRWGFAYLLVLLAVWSVRRERDARAVRIASAIVVALSSVWSFEVFVYTGVTYLALVAYSAAAQGPERGWIRRMARMLVPALIACVVAHLALALWTIVRAEQLPDWSPYLAILREYSAGALNRVVAEPWWPGIVMAAFLFTSAVGVGAIVSRAPRFEAENRAALLAIAGMTAFATAAFSYAVRFSTEDYISRMDLAVAIVLALWIHVLWRSEIGRPARIALAATGCWLAAVVVVAGWDHLEREAGRTPLVAALPGNGRSVESEISHAWGNPFIIPSRSAPAEALIERYWPDSSDRPLVLLHPDVAVEALTRSERVNLLPVSYMLADDLVPEERWGQVRAVVDDVQPGTLMLTEGFYLTPGATRNYNAADQPPLELERLIMSHIRGRFRLKRVATEKVGFDPAMGDDELVVVRLVERGRAGAG
jgi:hypothetical protein